VSINLTHEESEVVRALQDAGMSLQEATLAVVMFTRGHERPENELVRILDVYPPGHMVGDKTKLAMGCWSCYSIDRYSIFNVDLGRYHCFHFRHVFLQRAGLVVGHDSSGYSQPGELRLLVFSVV
jgi:hypothetical protein